MIDNLPNAHPPSSHHFSPQDEAFMTMAMAEAHLAELAGEVPVGAVLISEEGEVIAKGRNEVIGLNDPTAHAEMQVLRSAGTKLQNYRLLNTTLYITLEPCPMCAGAILHGRVGRVVFGALDKKTGAAGSVINLFDAQTSFHYATVEAGLLEGVCREQLQAFFKRRRKEKKVLREQALIDQTHPAQ